MSDFRQYRNRLENARGNPFEESHRRLVLRKLKDETMYRQALHEKRRVDNSDRFNLQNNYELPDLPAPTGGPKMTYLHEVLSSPGQQPLQLNRRLRQ